MGNLYQLRPKTSTEYLRPTATPERGISTRSPLLQDAYSFADLPTSAAGWADVAEGLLALQALNHRKATALVSSIFADCLAKWKLDTQFTSSATEIVLHPSYQRIIGLGPDVLPFIFRELAREGAPWYSALTALTGENPVARDDRGRSKKMQAAWLAWAVQKGYLDA